MDYWQKAPSSRRQAVLFATTLDERIPENHPVRLLDELLAQCDWRLWETPYHGRRGQPPIHPRVLAAAILYGLMRRIRSSRQLEYAINHNIDFMWLVESRSIDHTTLSEFRRKFQKELKDLYRRICRLAMAMGLLRLAEVAIDGTRVRADCGRYNTLTRSKAEKLLQELEVQLGQALQALELEDRTDELFLGEEESFDRLPPELADLAARRAKLAEMLEQLREAEKAKRREGVDPEKHPPQIPLADPDSRVLPNKEGGFAPNYTPMAMTDMQGGFIVSADVLASTAEQNALLAMVDDVHTTFEQLPGAVFGDGVYPTGDNLECLDRQNVELLSPLSNASTSPDNPALRDDPKQPVAEEDRARLPINPQSKRLDKAAFVYHEEQDRYYCPEGRSLEYEETKAETRRGNRIERRIYRSPDCSGCPLRDLCCTADNKRGRTVGRDVHEERRAAHAQKMAQPEAKERYKKRFHSGEVPFAYLKHVLGLRRFLLRGLDNVKTEWLWACTAYNLMKFMRGLATVRALPTQPVTATAN